MVNIRKLEKELWEAADSLRANSKLTSNEYCMPVLGLIFLRYAFGRYKIVEAEIMRNRPTRSGVSLPVTPEDFKQKSAMFLPEESRFDYLISLPDGTDLGEALNNAMDLIEKQSSQLVGVMPKNYTAFENSLLKELLRIFNNQTLSEVGGDIIGRIYEYFLSKFAPVVAQDDGVFFTPISLVQMIVNVIEPKRGIVLDPACGSGGMFVQTGYFLNKQGEDANTSLTFYGQEKTEYNAKLALMNLSVHGLNGNIKSGNDANTFYNDAYSLNGRCDYVMANPPFNVDKVKSDAASNAGRLPFGLPGVNKQKEVSNANYLWIQYFYSYLNDNGRAGFVMASSATDSGNKDRDIRKELVETGDVDVMVSVGNNFFYTKSLPCSLWFFDKAKKKEIKDKVLFLDARNYHRIVDRTLNDWSEYQLKNLNAIVWLYRGEKEKYTGLLGYYFETAQDFSKGFKALMEDNKDIFWLIENKKWNDDAQKIIKYLDNAGSILECYEARETLKNFIALTNEKLKVILAFVENTDKFSEIKASEGIPKELVEEYRNLTQFKKRLSERCETIVEFIKEFREVLKQAKWLTDKFGNGVYTDILGLCKVATLEDISEKNYSLTSGGYVGVAPVIDTESDNFAERMSEIHQELLSLQGEANELMEKISANFEELML